MNDSHDSFLIKRLNFVRLPPAELVVAAAARTPCLCKVDLVISITDDYGTDFDTFDTLSLQLDVVDPRTSALSTGATIESVNGRLGTSFDVRGVAGPYHKLQIGLRVGSDCSSIAFRLSGCNISTAEDTTDFTSQLLACTGAALVSPASTYEDERVALLPVTTGEVALSRKATSETAASQDKVTTTIRNLQLTGGQVVQVFEQPSLHNSTGQRLWDSAILMAAFLNDRPEQLVIAGNLPLHVLELGAGCGTSGLAAEHACALTGLNDATVSFTDVPEVVDTTLSSNLARHDEQKGVKRQVKPLTWGKGSEADIDTIIKRPCQLTVIASDVLYNTSSHDELMFTVQALASHRHVRRFQMLVAYKHRTEGDGRFFDMARAKGFDVCRLRLWGGVSIWQLQ